MKSFATLLFFAAFLGWAWLEFLAAQPHEGLQDILFWTGMGALLIHGYDRRSAPRA